MMSRRNRADPLADIRRRIIAGTAEPDIRISGKLDLSGERIRRLPENLSVGWINLSDCDLLEELPRTLHARRISLTGAWDPSHLLTAVNCFQLDLNNSHVRDLPAELQVHHRLDLSGCRLLRSLPPGLSVGTIVLRDCATLVALPEAMRCYFLDISGCTAIEGWPESAFVEVGRLAARGCIGLRALPAWLKVIAQLDLRDCRGISVVPDTLSISSWIDVAGTGIRSLPKHLDGLPIRWRGVQVDARIAFFPESITVEEILSEINAEKRRVLLERMGYEQFLMRTNAEILDEDSDPGGIRRLLRVAMKDDEALVCVSVLCPSTGRQYFIRVPPSTTSCRQAVAWVAGFENPDDYHPLAET